MDQPKDVAEVEERDRVTGFTNAGKSWVSHPVGRSGEGDASPACWAALVSIQRHGAADGQPASWLLLICGALGPGLVS